MTDIASGISVVKTKIKKKLIYLYALLFLFAGSATGGTVSYISSDGLFVRVRNDKTIVLQNPERRGLGNCGAMPWFFTAKAGITQPIYWTSIPGDGNIIASPDNIAGIRNCDNNHFSSTNNFGKVYFKFTPDKNISIFNSGYNHYQKLHSEAGPMIPGILNPFTANYVFWRADVEWWYPDITKSKTMKPGVYSCEVTVNVYYQLYNNFGDDPGNMGVVSHESGHSDRITLEQCKL
ncbi:hypothetical protein YL93_17535 [Salmonella enterica subsp. enterica serovar Montevideo]|nr:hypothetical protein [Salmonella enterica subsp. enterica serovar Montevideo]